MSPFTKAIKLITISPVLIKYKLKNHGQYNINPVKYIRYLVSGMAGSTYYSRLHAVSPEGYFVAG